MTLRAVPEMPPSKHKLQKGTRSSSREIRIRVPTFLCSRGTPPLKKKGGEKGHLAGG